MRGWMLMLAVALGVTVSMCGPHSASAQDEKCAGADALRDAGETAAAHRAYTKLLLADPTLPCAREALTTLNASPSPTEAAGKLCGRADAYRRVSRPDDAEKAYKAALEKDASKQSCGEKGLDALDQSSSARFDKLVGALPDLAAALGLLLAAGLLVLLLGHWKVAFRIYRKLPIVKKILQPRLTLADLADRSEDTKAGAAVTARIRERLQRFQEEAEDEAAFADNLDFGTSAQELADIVSGDSGLESSLDKLGDLGGSTGAVAALIGLIVGMLPIKRFSFAGVIEPTSGPSAAATMSILAGQRLAGAVTLTGGKLDHEPEAGDYLALAGPGAVWVQYEIARAVADQKLPPEIAESYALVREGLDHHVAGDVDEAVIAFEQAVSLDSQNWAAKVNLAVTKARLAKDYATAETILAQAVEDFESEYS